MKRKEESSSKVKSKEAARAKCFVLVRRAISVSFPIYTRTNIFTCGGGGGCGLKIDRDMRGDTSCVSSSSVVVPLCRDTENDSLLWTGGGGAGGKLSVCDSDLAVVVGCINEDDDNDGKDDDDDGSLF